MTIDHISRAKKAWPLLVRRAAEGGFPFTYKELSTKLGLHYRAAQWFLGVIQSYCKQNHLPPLQALVVNQKSRLPGTGYIGSARSRAAHKRALNRVYAEPWSLTPPKFAPNPSFKRDA